MKTELLAVSPASLKRAGELIRNGETVAFPTETVYGLGADALNGAAVKKIFEAKGRPGDNPLIVHIYKREQAAGLASSIPEAGRLLMEKFMPGPITVVMPKSGRVPAEVTAGLDTVGIRMPSHPGARQFLEACGCPIAAPSANTSGKPSPTRAEHVLDDLNGKIPLILDGGPCEGGVESTVISVCTPVPLLLRPGLVTYEQLTAVLGRVDIHPAVLSNARVDKAASPGMKYKHYSPTAEVFILDTDFGRALKAYDAFILQKKKPLLLWNGESLTSAGGRNARAFTDHGDGKMAAEKLFNELRMADDAGFDVVLVTALPTAGAGMSVMNRLLRAAAFRVVDSRQIDDGWPAGL